MTFSIFIPKIALQPYVECYWLVEGEGLEKQIVVPDGCSELIFHLGDFYRIHEGDGQFRRQDRALVAGQITRPIALEPEGNSCVLGIKFKPEGLWKLFRVPMKELTNQVYSFRDVLGSTLREWHDQLDALTNTQRIHYIEKELEQMITGSNRTVTLDPIIRKIEDSNGGIAINSLCTEFNISERKLQRMFVERVGVPAKMYSRISRFKHVYRLIQQPNCSKTDATYLLGYFDQPHFNNEFKEFTGESPELWFRNHQPLSSLFMNR